jgi:hypothetical protein
MPPDKKKKRGKKNWNLIYQFIIYQLIDARSGAQVSKLGIVMPKPNCHSERSEESVFAGNRENAARKRRRTQTFTMAETELRILIR